MAKYLVDGEETDEVTFDQSLRMEMAQECNDEKFSEWFDEYSYPYGIELGDYIFSASEVLYKMDKEEYDKQKESYITDQIDRAWDELEQSDYIIVNDIEFSVVRED